jgi:transposase
MAKALSIDLRDRLIAAVAKGMSRRQAAERFGVSAASAIRWCALERDVGDAMPKRQGGDRRSGRIEAHATLILSIVEQTMDITIAEVQAKLAEQGLSFGTGTLWRFFDRHRITLKKSRRPPPSRSGLMS